MSAEPQSPEPKEECDLIMKGGITSGVVYPQAVLALKERYRFRNIGGGSVGAIAAALTAAAELGRNIGGFVRFEEAQQKLKEEGFLLKVFRPPNTYKPLMDAALAFAPLLDDEEREKLGKAGLFRESKSILGRCHPRSYRKGRLLGAAVGAILGILVGAVLYLLFSAIVGQTGGSLTGWPLVVLVFSPVLVLGLLFGWLGGPVWAAYDLFRLATKKMPEDNFYGLCIGSGEPGTPEQPLLTDWLSGLFDDLAGRKGQGPLTFGHLKDADMEGKEPEEPGISLKMLTTNLNHREPYVFPRESNTFLFKEEDMRRFFPEDVFRHMCDYAAQTGVRPPEGFRFLPQGDDLPVIVPVRMAICFPVLLSTVPLYTIKESFLDRYRKNPGEELTEQDLQSNLFSDGGICSNFPIHFFDAWLPRRPTFGINLTSVPKEAARVAPEGEQKAAFSANDPVPDPSSSRATDTRTDLIRGPNEPWLPKPNAPDSREWTAFEGLIGFLRAIFYSAMNYRDTMQARLPSYQERTVQVPLGSKEGGLNLGMDPTAIGSIAGRGERAGKLLRDEFDFDRHRWVRLRVLLGQLESQLEGTHEALRSVIDEELVDDQLKGGFPYPFPDSQEERSNDAKELLQRLDNLVDYLKQRPGDRFPPIPDEDPQPAMRITPDV
jgi:predicted acylesterase/phospholipase RssA